MDTEVRKSTLGILKQQISQSIGKLKDKNSFKSKKANTLWIHISNFKE